MHEKTIKRKIFTYFSRNISEKDKEYLKEDLTLFLEKEILKKGISLLNLIAFITFTMLIIIIIYNIF